MISAGVLGSPISHSLSPLLHNTMYQILGVEANYKAYEVSSGYLRSFLSNQGSALNCISLTMPLKEEALEVADSVSPLSQQIRSGNTLYKVDGLWNLTSTDVEGFTQALRFNGRDAKGNVMIIGAGATARAAIAACDGVSKKVTVINRNPERVQAIRNSAPHLEVEFVSWDSAIDFSDIDLLINTTPGESASIFVKYIESLNGTFFEALYNPWPTQLVSRFREVGGFGIDGLELLIHQAISQMEIFASCKIERERVAQILRLAGEKELS